MKNVTHITPLARQLRWLMAFRMVITTFLLGTTFVVQFREVGAASDEALTALYALIGAIYFLAFLYATVLPKYCSEHIQAYIQIAGDIMMTTGVIYLTGGLDSAFSFMYILYIINAGLLLKTRGALISASISAILYGTMMDLHFYQYISPYMARFSYVDFYQPTDILNKILVNMGAFYLVAVLSGYLAKQAEESRMQLKERQSDLERLEDLNENIIQSIDTGVMTLGGKGEIRSFNSAAERITGFRFSDVIKRPYSMVFPGVEFPDEPTSDPGKSRIRQWNYVNQNQNELFLDIGLLGLRDRSGGSLGRLVVFDDKTTIYRMEEDVKRIERLAAIGEMAAGIAHEIRNPLASMSGSLQMLEEDLSEDESRKRLMNIIRREMDRLNHIVNDFLLFARPKTGDPAPIDLSMIVMNILSFFENQVYLNDRIAMEKNIEPGVWGMFDSNQFEQVMWNLLRNAVEAMPNGGLLTINLERAGSDLSDAAVIEVRDTGVGIAEEDLPKIFDPFFTTKDEGSGLGLSIVYRIVEGGGGRIEVFPNPGVGTTFRLYLPAAADQG